MSRVPKVIFVAGLLIMLFLYVPIFLLIGLSFNASSVGVAWGGFSVRWYEQLLTDASMVDATINSLVVAFISTSLSVVLGLGVALMVERQPRRNTFLMTGLLVLPLVIPEILLGVALLLLFVLCDIPLGFSSIIIGHMVFNVPLSVVMLRARLQKLDPTLEDAARDLGASSWEVLTRITFPMLAPAIWGAALLCFTVSLDDFVVTFFLAGPGSTTLPLKVFSMIKTGVTPEVNALSAVLVTVSMICVGVSWVFQRRALS